MLRKGREQREDKSHDGRTIINKEQNVPAITSLTASPTLHLKPVSKDIAALSSLVMSIMMIRFI
jgi:hypothetical protein